ncbi:MAG TPA: hypothetical protein VK196_14585 [Magnetospirillum sp.]|nr:hypothetical protein [Magnetospirillum sp.]
MKSTRKYGLMVSVASAFALATALGGQSASAKPLFPPVIDEIPGGGADCCSLDWNFGTRGVTVNLASPVFTFGALSEICADQSFSGTQSSVSLAGRVNAAGISNSASSVANVISLNGGQDGDTTVRSSFPGVVDAVQSSYGTQHALAVSWDGTATDYRGFENLATAASNVVSVNTTSLALLDVTQTVGKEGAPSAFNTAAVLRRAHVTDGNLNNASSSVANVASLDVAPSTYGGTSLALVNVTQSANANMWAATKGIGATVGGNFTNTATSAANVISVINK